MSTPVPLLKTFEVLGDGWSFFIVREAFFGVRRFESFKLALGLPRSRLSERLSHLVQHGVLKKVLYQKRPQRYEYRLTPKGYDIYSMTLMMKQWGDQWRSSTTTRRLELVHKSCSSIVSAEIICDHCDREVELSDLSLKGIPEFQEIPKFGVRRQLLRKAFENDQRNDAVARTLAIIGDQWSMMVVMEAFLGSRKFDEFKQRLGVARSTLSARLNHLFEENIFEKKSYQDHPPRYEYRLTDAGKDLFRVLLMMHFWGSRWYGNKQDTTEVIHQTCGAALEPKVVCQECHAELVPWEVEIRLRDQQ